MHFRLIRAPQNEISLGHTPNGHPQEVPAFAPSAQKQNSPDSQSGLFRNLVLDAACQR
jgi:hypothetical protein